MGKMTSPWRPISRSSRVIVKSRERREELVVSTPVISLICIIGSYCALLNMSNQITDVDSGVLIYTAV